MQGMPYAGKELELFQHATLWKKYFGSFIKSYLHGKILEVGAGIGSTTIHICDGTQEEWICLEPDRGNWKELDRRIQNTELPVCCVAVQGTIDDLPKDKKFNAILYIDVIEHISNEKAELEKAVQLLEPGGYLIILVPAHQRLYSPFDKAIGHHRRYNKKMLEAAVPAGISLRTTRYFDSIGMIAALMNKYFLKQDYPSLRQIHFWDRVLVRISKITDPLTAYSLGKSLIGIWSRPK
jgi:ubiquinone/menaquinone biosynthesis C-methylase UbiE